LEWLAAFLFFRYVAVVAGIDISFSLLLGIYSIAAIGGMMSFLPGGIGTFDLIVLVGLHQAGTGTSDALALLLLFRLFLFFLPAVLGIFFLVFNLTIDRNEKLFNDSFFAKFHFFNNVLRHYKTYSDFINVLLAVLVFSGGIVLLISSVKPGIEVRVAWLMQYVPPSVLHVSQIISIAIGFLLCVLALEIIYKVKRAYTLTVLALLAGGFLTFLKGLDFEEGLFLFSVLLLIRFSKPSFYRYSIPLRRTRVVAFALFGLFGILVYYAISEKIHLEFIESGFYAAKLAGVYGDIISQSAVTYTLFCCFLVALYFRKPRIEDDPLFKNPDLEKLKGFFEENHGGAFAHLLYLGDKNFFWATGGKTLIPYARYKNLIVVLGDPIGSPENFSSAIQEFQDFLDKYGYESVFYEISDKNLPVYHENGYYFFKLGEEAVVDLDAFSMAGAQRSKLRHTFNSFGKKGYSFEVIDPPFDKVFFAECREVSREWLGRRREMGFSMGWYHEDYLQRSPIATLRDSEKRLLAFVSLMPSYDGGQSMSTDLMRLRRGVPHGSMDYMMMNLILYLKEKNYKYFNLGMAPLSNVGVAPVLICVKKWPVLLSVTGSFFIALKVYEPIKKNMIRFGYHDIWRIRSLSHFPSRCLKFQC